MEKTGESTRQLKVAKEIQKEMAEIIRSKGMAAFGGALVSVSGVKISPDLSIAKIYVSIFPSEKAEAVMEVLDENNRALQASSFRSERQVSSLPPPLQTSAHRP